MRRMPPVIEVIRALDRRVFATAVLVTALACSLAVQPQTTGQRGPVLDLTKTSPFQGQSLGVPGGSGGGTLGESMPRGYELPLQIKILGSKRSPGAERNNVALEVLLRNTGRVPLDLPVSRDFVRVHQVGNKGRRAFLFKMRIMPSDGPHPIEDVVGSTSSAESIADSLLRLNPGQSVLVLLPVNLTSLAKELPTRVRTHVGIQVVCNEYTLEDDRYYVKSRSEEVRSEIAQIEIEHLQSGPRK